MRTEGLVATFVLCALAVAGAVGANSLPETAPPSVTSIFGFPPSRGEAPADPWEAMEPHAFLLGGFSLLSVGWPGGSGWTLSGGGEFPMPAGWSLVPRASLSGADTEGWGTVLLGRAAVDGRLTYKRAGILNYYEAGLGVGVQDFQTESWQYPLAPRREQKTTVGALFQLASGVRSDPNLGPAFVFEFLTSFGSGSHGVIALELLVGVEF